MEGKRMNLQSVVMTGMFAAVLAVLSQVSIPMPSGVPVTLQTFAVALTGYVLGWKLGGAAVVVYILLGAVGVPVFAGFHGGFGSLIGATGGFIWGFIFMTILCGIGMATKNKCLAAVFGVVGLAICHLLGIVQFSAVMERGFAESAMLASVPYLIKDVISVALALAIGLVLRKALNAAGILTYAKAKEA